MFGEAGEMGWKPEARSARHYRTTVGSSWTQQGTLDQA